jgi:hypothetical protein
VLSDEELIQLQTRGRRALEVLENPEYLNAWDAVETAIIARWKDPKYTESDREKLWLSLQMMREVQRVLFGVVQNGQIAEKDLNGIAKHKRFKVV